jgi:hypothetical protein
MLRHSGVSAAIDAGVGVEVTWQVQSNVGTVAANCAAAGLPAERRSDGSLAVARYVVFRPPSRSRRRLRSLWLRPSQVSAMAPSRTSPHTLQISRVLAAALVGLEPAGGDLGEAVVCELGFELCLIHSSPPSCASVVCMARLRRQEPLFTAPQPRLDSGAQARALPWLSAASCRCAAVRSPLERSRTSTPSAAPRPGVARSGGARN